MLWLLLTFLTFSSLQSITAQSDASCLPFYNWTFNSNHQTPCQVVSSLLAVCNGGPFPVVALPDSTHYLGPSLENANPCQCNTVTYSLMSACGACQGRTYVTWSVWTTNCAMVYTDMYPEPIPSGVSVPGWAYLDVEALDNFDQSNARNNANLTESSAIPSPTSSTATTTKALTSPKVTLTTKGVSSTSASQSIPASTTTSTVAAPSATSAGSSTTSPSIVNANALGGGIVGGLFGLSIVFGLMYWFIHRRRRIAGNVQHLSSPTATEDANWHSQSQGPYMTQVSTPHAPVLPSFASMGGDRAPYNLDSSVSGSADSVPVGHVRV